MSAASGWQLRPGYIPNSDPRFHLFAGDERERGLLVVDGSRIHLVNDRVADLLAFASDGRPELVDDVFRTLGLSAGPIVGESIPHEIPVRAFSLAIAQKCNRGCT